MTEEIEVRINLGDFYKLIDRAETELRIQCDEYGNDPTDEDVAFMSRMWTLSGRDRPNEEFRCVGWRDDL